MSDILPVFPSITAFFARTAAQPGPLDEADAQAVEIAVTGLQALLDQGRELLRRPRHHGNSIFKVKLQSAIALVEAPNATAAAVFFGKECKRGEGIGVSVLEINGKIYRDRTPWLSWQFGISNPHPRDWERVTQDLRICRVAEWLS